ncbi:unnamed protein product [Rhizopus stolonifer]
MKSAINRLDTMTSGLMLIAKSSERAGKVKKELRERMVEKEYICKVTGCFPSERTVCEAPMKQLSFLVPLNYVHPTGPLENPEEIVQSMIDCTPFDYMLDPFEKSDLPRCQECSVPIIQKDLVHQNLALWLHAVKYSGNKWSYESPLPAWTGNPLI